MENATRAMTLSEFLLARIAEDEALAHRVSDFDGYDEVDPSHWTQARVLADCEAKRQIVETLHAVGDRTIHPDAWVAMRGVVSALAAVYHDHPDYRAEWAS